MSVSKLLLIVLLCFSTTHASNFDKDFNESVVLSDQSNFKGAISVLESIRENSEHKFEHHYQLGTLFCKEKKFTKCIVELKKALKINPEDRRVGRNLEIAYMEQKKKKGEKKQEKQDKKKNKKNKKKNKNQKRKSQMDKFNKKFKTQIKSHEFVEQKIFKKRLKKNLENPNLKFKKDW